MSVASEPEAGEARAGGPLRALTVIGKILLGVAALLSAFVVVAGAFIYVGKWYDDRYRWRQAEYRKLTALHAGFAFARFKEELGTPVFSRRDDRSGLREDSFMRRGYWVQTTTRPDGTVLTYAVTSCDAKFNPKFVLRGSNRSPRGRPASVVLRRTRMADVMSSEDVTADYFQGATANTYYLDEWYGANPGNYKSYSWGLTDGCPDGSNEVEGVYKVAGTPRLPTGSYRGPVTRSTSQTRRFRRRAYVNTYAETAPLVDFRHGTDEFHIGVDRILTRTTQ